MQNNYWLKFNICNTDFQRFFFEFRLSLSHLVLFVTKILNSYVRDDDVSQLSLIEAITGSVWLVMINVFFCMYCI